MCDGKTSNFLKVIGQYVFDANGVLQKRVIYDLPSNFSNDQKLHYQHSMHKIIATVSDKIENLFETNYRYLNEDISQGILTASDAQRLKDIVLKWLGETKILEEKKTLLLAKCYEGDVKDIKVARDIITAQYELIQEKERRKVAEEKEINRAVIDTDFDEATSSGASPLFSEPSDRAVTQHKKVEKEPKSGGPST